MLYCNKNKKTCSIEKVFKYIDDNNMKDIVSYSSVLLENDINDLKSYLETKNKGDIVTILLERKDKEKTINITE